MEIKNTPMLFQQELNRFYKDILNCDIVHPPYWAGRVPETFFFKKRGGIESYKDWGGDGVIDYTVFDGEEYVIVRDGDEIVIKKRGDPIIEIDTQDFNSGVFHSFKSGFQGCSGQLLDSGTGLNGSTSGGIFYLTDASKSWTTNEFAGKFIMITDGPGIGQVFKISANDDTILTLSFGWDTAPVISSYKIFDSYGEVLAFIGEEGIYIIHNDDEVSRLDGFQEVIDADWHEGRIFAVDSNNNLLCSATETNDGTQPLGGGYFSGYLNASSLIGGMKGTMRVISFNNVVLLFSEKKINIIKKVVADKTGTSFDTFINTVGTDYIGLHSPKAVRSYNSGLYMLTTKNSLASINIEDGFQGKYKVTTEDMGIDIQQRLDGIRGGDSVAIGINNDDIFVLWGHNNGSTVFRYNMYYKFWYRRETNLLLKNIYVSIDEVYMGDITYYYNKESEKDFGGNDFTQLLRFFNGDSDIFSLKTILYHKLYLGVDTKTTTEVNYKARLSEDTYEYTIPFKNISYLQKSSNLSGNQTLGTNILGYGILGGLSEKSLVSQFLSDVNIIEIPLGLTYSLLEITISGNFEIGGNIIGATVHDPHLTPYEDVASDFR